MTRTLASVLAAAALAAGCKSSTPEISSSSSWVTCRTIDDCTLPEAAACTAGYCVDASGARLEAPNGSPGPCDPLAPHELPVTLGTILGIGTAPDGTVYLADEITTPSTLDRVFVSSGGALVRHRVTGSGSNGGGADADYTLSFEDGMNGAALLIQRRGGALTGIGLGAPGGKAFFSDPGAVTTPLTPAGESAIAGLALKNLPGDVAIEYVADLDTGEVIVVTHPADDYGYEDFRLFFGMPADVSERKVQSVTRARDGGSTTIEFLLGTYHAVAHFPWFLGPLEDGGTSSHPLPGDVDVGKGTPVPLVRRYPNPGTLDGMSFTCF